MSAWRSQWRARGPAVGGWWLVAVISTFVAGAAGADERPHYPVYVNDDGLTCTLMVDVKSAAQGRGELHRPLDATWTRRQLVRAAGADKLELCSQESSLVLVAIVTHGTDAYGQPQWDKVEYLHEFAARREALLKLTPAAGDPEVEEVLIER